MCLCVCVCVRVCVRGRVQLELLFQCAAILLYNPVRGWSLSFPEMNFDMKSLCTISISQEANQPLSKGQTRIMSSLEAAALGARGRSDRRTRFPHPKRFRLTSSLLVGSKPLSQSAPDSESEACLRVVLIHEGNPFRLPDFSVCHWLLGRHCGALAALAKLVAHACSGPEQLQHIVRVLS